jgi:hypothetical protein
LETVTAHERSAIAHEEIDGVHPAVPARSMAELIALAKGTA